MTLSSPALGGPPEARVNNNIMIGWGQLGFSRHQDALNGYECMEYPFNLQIRCLWVPTKFYINFL